MSESKKEVSLVLGSGGARGLAHIGIIRWLEENGYQIKSISGCSMGAVVGGIYAAGKLDEFEQWVRAIKRLDIIALLDISWRKNGLVKGDKIIDTLIDLVGEQQIEELPIPYTAVAADVTGEKEVWLQSGSLFDAIRASISLPMFFTPFSIKGVDLIDGGVLNPVPIAPTFGDHTDMTIAVNLGGPAKFKKKPKKVEPDDKKPSIFTAKISHYISKFQSSLITDSIIDLSAYDIANQAFDAMQGTIARLKLAAYPPDYTVEIARNACGTFDFDRASEIIELGYTTAEETLGPLLGINQNEMDDECAISD
jgi:NTE family protein